MNNMSQLSEQLREMQKQQAEELKKQEDKMPSEVLEELERVQNQDETKKKAEELQRALFQKTVENIRLSESIRMELNKDDFSDKDKVIDTLLYIVGLMAKDNLFYQTNVVKLANYEPKYKA